jgi:hypothetical protein
MTEWTTELVEERLFDAADVLKRMPEQRIQGYFNTWPAIFRSFDDLVGQQPQPMRRPLPSAKAIDEMETVLQWLGWLEPDVAKLAWARAERTPWKEICWRFGISRAAANRRWEYAMSMITWRLVGRRMPVRLSRRRIVERLRSVSETSARHPT